MRKEIVYLGVGFSPGITALGLSMYQEAGMSGIAILTILLAVIVTSVAALLLPGKAPPLPLPQQPTRAPH